MFLWISIRMNRFFLLRNEMTRLRLEKPTVTFCYQCVREGHPVCMTFSTFSHHTRRKRRCRGGRRHREPPATMLIQNSASHSIPSRTGFSSLLSSSCPHITKIPLIQATGSAEIWGGCVTSHSKQVRVATFQSNHAGSGSDCLNSHY